MKKENLSWETLEHSHQEHSSDWFWGIGIVAIGIAVLSIYFGNILFAVVILLAAFTSVLYAHAEPREIKVRLDKKGLRVDNSLFPYTTLEAFWVEDVEEHGKDQLIVRSRKVLVPYIIIPIPESVKPAEVQDFLLNYLPEEEMEEPLSHKIMETLGF